VNYEQEQTRTAVLLLIWTMSLLAALGVGLVCGHKIGYNHAKVKISRYHGVATQMEYRRFK
jgi:hypothetical protein